MATKLELQQTLAALSTEVQALRITCAEQAQTIVALKATGAQAAKSFVRREPVVTEAQLAYRANCAAARAAAVSSGRAVLVGAADC